MPGADEDLSRQLARLTRQAVRERTARLEAEQLLEQKSLELYDINQRLVALNADLERRVQIRTHDLEHERRRAVTLAEQDLLTGLANRARFQSHLDAVINGCASSGQQAALLIIDLDRFKQINDRFGHGTGDTVLVQAAERLRQTCRDHDLIARLGGDEFAVVLLASDNGLLAGTALAGRVCKALKVPYIAQGTSIETSCSIGIAAVPAHGTLQVDLMRYADLALYAAKEDGRGRFAVFEQKLLAEFEDRHELEQDLRAAVANGDISIWFQPIVEVQTGRIVGAEALARWFHPRRGMIPPDRFIQIAEQRGLIGDLGRHVLETACEQALPFLRNGSMRRISVNVSPLQLQDFAIVQQIGDTLRKYAMTPAQLLLEVTESVMLTDHPTVRKSLEALRAEGISLALDDFGAGYSNLSYLTELRADVLKIDRGFVRDVATTFATGAMIRSISALARELGIKVVVEGVETQRQHELITSYGCDFAQGYLFSKPLPAHELAMLLKTAAASPMPAAIAKAG